MALPFKLLFFVAVPLLAIVGVVFFVSAVLLVDDLARCEAVPSTVDRQCASADAIVAISGGDTDARTREAIRLYQAGWAPNLVFSGAAEDKAGLSNAAAMRNQAVKAGVPADAITLDEQANDTAANAAGLMGIARQLSLKRLILVTSPYHQRRASIEFARALGPAITIVNHPTAEDRYWPPYWWFNPYSWYLVVSEMGKLVYLNVSGK